MPIIDILKLVLGVSFAILHISNVFLLRKLRKKTNKISKLDLILLLLLTILFIAICILFLACDFIIFKKPFTAGRLIIVLIIVYLQIIPVVCTVFRLRQCLNDKSAESGGNSSVL